jgi:hypothetical protein
MFAYALLFVALLISGVAEYYSILGLTAIFPAAFWSVVIMGASLGLGKIMATVWLHRNWHRAGWLYKAYLVPAVMALMVLTSMGVFGYLSQAHVSTSSEGVRSTEQLLLIDERINIQQSVIDRARVDMAQLNAQVDAYRNLGSVSRGVTERRRQQAERQELQTRLTNAQTNIAQLREQRAPISIELNRVEAKVGPIKYVAAIIYGDNPADNLLERAVRWMIILIVSVFDPLALMLILAATKEIEWAKQRPGASTATDAVRIVEVATDHIVTVEKIVEVEVPVDRVVEKIVYPSDITSALAEKDIKIQSLTSSVDDLSKRLGKITTLYARDLTNKPGAITYGVSTPSTPTIGDVHVDTTVVPHVLVKFTGPDWISVDKSTTDGYLASESYLRDLADLIQSGVLAADQLTEVEQATLEQFLLRT